MASHLDLADISEHPLELQEHASVAGSYGKHNLPEVLGVPNIIAERSTALDNFVTNLHDNVLLCHLTRQGNSLPRGWDHVDKYDADGNMLQDPMRTRAGRRLMPHTSILLSVLPSVASLTVT